MDLLAYAIPLTILGIVTLYIIYKVYHVMRVKKFESDVKMTGKVVLITGANSGIGKETARNLASRGAKVIMACRNQETAHKVCEEIIKETKNEQVFVKKLDLSSLQSVRDFAANILETEKVIDVLIHNAGILLFHKQPPSVDGIEMTFATNHYGPFLLTHLLIDLVKKSLQGRIIVVSSEGHCVGRVNFNNLNPIDHPIPIIVYGSSKMANILFTVELAKRLKGTNVTANCLHPGVICTPIFDCLPFPLSLLKKLFRTPVDGAQTSLYLACSPEIVNISGKYFMACKIEKPKKKSTDDVKAENFWQLSKEMVKLTEDESKI